MAATFMSKRLRQHMLVPGVVCRRGPRSRRRTSWISIDTLGRSTIFQADKRALLQVSVKHAAP